MKSVKKKFFSVIISSFMVCNLFSGITTYANDSLDNRQNTNVSMVYSIKDPEESVKMQSKMQTSNTLTEAESVWNNCSYKGEGMVIAVIDTGFDYTHKDFQTIDEENVKITKDLADNDIKNLGYGKYFSEKIPYGYNYADGNDEIKNEDQIHGMHVAGIALANGEIKGVAPEAQLLAMRVADKNGQFNK